MSSPSKCPACQQHYARAPSTFDLSFARDVASHQSPSAARNALVELLAAFDSLAAEYANCLGSKDELETQVKIARSNLAMAEANSEMLQDALKKKPSRTPELPQAAVFPSVASPPQPVTERERTTSFWKRKRPALATQTPPDSGSEHGSTTDSNLSLRPWPAVPQSPVDSELDPSQLKTQLALLSSDHRKAHSDLASAQSALHDLQQQHSKLQDTHASFVHSHEKLAADHEALKQEIESLSQELFEEANKMVADERKARIGLEQQILALKTELVALKTQTQQEAQHMLQALPATSKPSLPALKIPARTPDALDSETPVDSMFPGQRSGISENRSPGLEAAKSWFSSFRRKSPVSPHPPPDSTPEPPLSAPLSNFNLPSAEPDDFNEDGPEKEEGGDEPQPVKANGHLGTSPSLRSLESPPRSPEDPQHWSETSPRLIPAAMSSVDPSGPEKSQRPNSPPSQVANFDKSSIRDSVSTISWDSHYDMYMRDSPLQEEQRSPEKRAVRQASTPPTGLDTPKLPTIQTTAEQAIAAVLDTHYTSPVQPALPRRNTSPSDQVVRASPKAGIAHVKASEMLSSPPPPNLKALRAATAPLLVGSRPNGMLRAKSETSSNRPAASRSVSPVPPSLSARKSQAPPTPAASRAFLDKFEASKELENKHLFSRAGRLRERQKQESKLSMSVELDSLLSDLKAEYGMEEER